jgi:kynureninase
MTITSLTPTPSTMSGSNAIIATAVLAKSLDVFQQTGLGIVRMMELSVNPHIGQNIDIKI